MEESLESLKQEFPALTAALQSKFSISDAMLHKTLKQFKSGVDNGCASMIDACSVPVSDAPEFSEAETEEIEVTSDPDEELEPSEEYEEQDEDED